MRVAFIGSTQRGFLTLKGLVEHGAEVVGIISLEQDAHEANRYEAQIASFAQQHSIALYQTKWMKERDYAAVLRDEWRADTAFVVGCRVLIPQSIFSVLPKEMYAVHDSLVPEYRGFAPLNWAILNGETQTGVTLFSMAELMDGGDIVLQESVPIGAHDTAPQVYAGVCDATVNAILKAHDLLKEGTLTRTPQDYSVGSFTASRTPSDGLLDWAWSTERIYNMVRALAYPYAGAFTYYKNQKLMIWRAEPLDDPRRFVGRITGRVLHIDKPTGAVDVLTGDGILRVFEVQWGDGERVPATTLLKSVRERLGVDVPHLLEQVQTLQERVTRLEQLIEKQAKNHHD